MTPSTSEAGVEGRDDRLDQQIGKNLLAEQVGAGTAELLAPFGFNMRPPVEQLGEIQKNIIRFSWIRNERAFFRRRQFGPIF
jgi:hypothetical protein